jgi:hypothetical protein
LIIYSTDQKLTRAPPTDEFEASLPLLRRVFDAVVKYGKRYIKCQQYCSNTGTQLTSLIIIATGISWHFSAPNSHQEKDSEVPAFF